MPVALHQLRDGAWQSLTDSSTVPPPTVNTYHQGAATMYAFADADAAYGPLTVRRSYNGVGERPATWAVSAAGDDVGKRASVWSCKPGVTGMADGTYDSWLTGFVQSIPDTHTAWLCVEHEADAKIRKGDYTTAQFLAAFRRFADLVHAVGKPRVAVTAIFTAYLWNPQQTLAASDLYPGNAYVDVLGVDGYGLEHQTPQAQIFANSRQFAIEENVPFAVGETGCQETGDPADKAAWVTAGADWAATAGTAGRASLVYHCWFDSDVGGSSPTPSSSNAAMEAARTVCLSRYRNPL